MKLFVNIGVLSALAVCALATGGGWQAESTGWRSGPSFTWKQGTHQVSGAVLDGRSPTTGWINPAVPSAVGGGGGGGGSDGGWQAAAPATHYSGPVSYAAPAPSAGSGWTTPIISHPKPVSYSGWQSPSAPVRVAAAPQPSAGYSVTWTAPAAPQRAIPVAITYGGGSSGSGQVWQMPVPASAGWTSVPVIMKSAGWPMGSGGWAMGMGNGGGAWRAPGVAAGSNQWMAMAGGD